MKRPLRLSCRDAIPRMVLSHLFTVGLFLTALLLLFNLVSPFVGSLVGAITLGISFYPMHRWIAHKFPKRSPSFHAALSDFLVLIFLVAPLVLLTWAAIDQSDNWGPLIKDWQQKLGEWRQGRILEEGSLQDIRGWLLRTFGLHTTDVREQVGKFANTALGSVIAFGGKAAGQFISSLGSVALGIFVLFFVFRDGPAFYSRFEMYLPLREEQKEECKERGIDMISGVIRGWFLGAVIQGAVAGIGYLIVGIKSWFLLTFLTILVGILPAVGTALVWVPLGVSALMRGDTWRGVFLLVWGVGIVSLIDNVLRPYLAGKKSDVPFLYLMLALLGGIAVWGIKGIILGPTLVAIAPVIFEIYRKRYTSPVEPPQTRQNDGPVYVEN